MVLASDGAWGPPQHPVTDPVVGDVRETMIAPSDTLDVTERVTTRRRWVWPQQQT
jgi:hypothetical protein